MLGDIVNTNAQYLSKELAALGIGVYFQTVVGDNSERLLSAFEIAFGRADIIITSGGLGPTADDLTKETSARYFNLELVEDKTSMELLEGYFKRNSFVMTENNRKQAYFPVGGIILKNNHGTAPGCLIEKDGKMLFNLPGPPKELIPMFEDEVKPILREKSGEVFFSRTINMCGIGESHMETVVSDLIATQSNPTIAPYAGDSQVRLRVTAKAPSEEEACAIMQPTVEEMYKRFGEHIFGEDKETLEQVVVELLKDKGLTLAVAESCTGGMIAARVVSVPDVSTVFLEGAVTYSNQAKVSRLSVKQETLDSFGAVSEETAQEMAEGIAKSAGSHVGLATTGIAGPGGGTAEKPVGLVYISIYMKGKCLTKKLNFKGDREKIRVRATVFALDFLRRVIKNDTN